MTGVRSASLNEDSSGDSMTYQVSLYHSAGVHNLTRGSSSEGETAKRELVAAIDRFLSKAPGSTAPPSAALV